MIKENFKFPLLELVELVIGNPQSRETLIQKLNQDEHHVIRGKSFQLQPLLVLSNLNFKFLVCSFQYLILRLDSYQKTQQSLGIVWARPQVILVFEQKKSLAKCLEQSKAVRHIALTKSQRSKRQPLNSLRWLIYVQVFNSVVNTKLPVKLSYQRSITVSLET